jgi:hypothetical protein
MKTKNQEAEENLHVPLGDDEKRAGDGIRTRDLLLGKEVFYQLNYARWLIDIIPWVPRRASLASTSVPSGPVRK